MRRTPTISLCRGIAQVRPIGADGPVARTTRVEVDTAACTRLFLLAACLNTLALCRSGFLEEEETNVGLPRQDLQGHALKIGERANAKRRFPTTQTASLRQTRIL